ATLDQLGRHVPPFQGEAIAVTDGNGWLSGVLAADSVRAVPAERRATTRVRQVALPLDQVVIGRPDEPATSLLERMTGRGGAPALVVDDHHRLAGIVSVADLRRTTAWLQHRQMAG
ncbi:MAG TPA: CBS domain-containing protein, partial [Acidimicrobiales bacterium]|nr:CBS domain-containing protein [Acidimicrobiales bacterium]